jgi:hypothetical protein
MRLGITRATLVECNFVLRPALFLIVPPEPQQMAERQPPLFRPNLSPSVVIEAAVIDFQSLRRL